MNIPNLNLFPWENQATHAFLDYDDISNFSLTTQTEIKKNIGNNLSCYLFFDFVEEGDFSITLKIDFVDDFIFNIGLLDLDLPTTMNYAGLHYSFDKVPFLLFSNTTKHSIWLENTNKPFFTTFPLASLKPIKRAAQIKKEVALIDYIEQHFSTYYHKSSRNFHRLNFDDDYFYFDDELADYIDAFLNDLCHFCLNDAKYEPLRKWSSSKSSITLLGQQQKDNFESFVFEIEDLLTKMQTNNTFKDVLLDCSKEFTLKERIKEQKRAWHHAYMDVLGGLDHEDYFMIFSRIMDY